MTFFDVLQTKTATDVRKTDFYSVLRKFKQAFEAPNKHQFQQLQQVLKSIKINVEDVEIKNLITNKEVSEQNKIKCIQVMLRQFAIHCKNSEIDMLFCHAALLDPDRLQSVIRDLQNKNLSLNQQKFRDTPILFLIKYADVQHGDFLETLTILIEVGIDTNFLDYSGFTAVDHIALLYKGADQKHLIEAAHLLLRNNHCDIEDDTTRRILVEQMHLDLANYKLQTDEKQKYFVWLLRKNLKKFEAAIERKEFVKYANADDGDSTLLQLAARRCKDEYLPFVQVLLKNNANPNTVTVCNNVTALELASKYGNEKIFEAILHHKSTTITQQQFQNFANSRSIKMKFFQMLLESGKLDLSFAHTNTGYSPFHYAVFSSNKTAIKKMLKRSPCLVSIILTDQSLLQNIIPSCIKDYFDSCVSVDNYREYFMDPRYKMHLRFKCLIEEKNELQVVNKIGQTQNLEHLLLHPLIRVFLELKWSNAQPYYWQLLITQLFLFIHLGFCLFNFADVSRYYVWIFTFLNVLVKSPVVISGFKHAKLHTICETILMLATVLLSLGVLDKVLRAFAFPLMAICFLHSVGYHPNLSKWSIMLQVVFKRFTTLLVFFSILIVSFSISFNILYPQVAVFAKLKTSIPATFVMTVGEFNSLEMKFAQRTLGEYLIFVIFAMSVSLVIINFWIGVAVTDINRIRKKSKINAYRNLIVFMLFLDRFYYKFTRLVNFLHGLLEYVFPIPLLFIKPSGKADVEANYDPAKFELDIYPNNKSKSNFGESLSKSCLYCLQSYHQAKTNSAECRDDEE